MKKYVKIILLILLFILFVLVCFAGFLACGYLGYSFIASRPVPISYQDFLTDFFVLILIGLPFSALFRMFIDELFSLFDYVESVLKKEKLESQDSIART